MRDPSLQPFPRWLARREPVIGALEENGIFHMLRRKPRGRHIDFAIQAASVLGAAVLVIGLLVSLIVLAAPCLAWLSLPVVFALAGKAVLWVSRPRAGSYPVGKPWLAPVGAPELWLVPAHPQDWGRAVLGLRLLATWRGAIFAGTVIGGLTLLLPFGWLLKAGAGWPGAAFAIACQLAALAWFARALVPVAVWQESKNAAKQLALLSARQRAESESATAVAKSVVMAFVGIAVLCISLNFLGLFVRPIAGLYKLHVAAADWLASQANGSVSAWLWLSLSEGLRGTYWLLALPLPWLLQRFARARGREALAALDIESARISCLSHEEIAGEQSPRG